MAICISTYGNESRSECPYREVWAGINASTALGASFLEVIYGIRKHHGKSPKKRRKQSEAVTELDNARFDKIGIAVTGMGIIESSFPKLGKPLRALLCKSFPKRNISVFSTRAGNGD